MALIDFFKPKWTSGTMTEADRRRMFYYLQRGTSVTAWQRVTDAFMEFANMYGRQVKEEPVKVKGMHRTDWAGFYPRVLAAQVAFEKGMQNLRQGDKQVFRYDSSRGYLNDALERMEYWFEVLVYNGPYGDIRKIGKYAEELTALVMKYGDTLPDADGLQSRWGDRPAPWYWSEHTRLRLHNQKVPQPEPRPPEYEDSYINYPDPLPELPQPQLDLVIRTDNEIPVTGIYEPQMRDGVMNYLVQGATAMRAGAGNQAEARSVAWKLIWADDRYLDGKIPEVETSYFVPRPGEVDETPPEVPASMPRFACRPGQTCPRAGRWIAPHLSNRIITVDNWQEMPGSDEKETTGEVIWYYLGPK